MVRPALLPLASISQFCPGRCGGVQVPQLYVCLRTLGAEADARVRLVQRLKAQDLPQMAAEKGGSIATDALSASL